MYRDGFWQTINTIDDPNANPFDRANNVAQTWEVNEKLTTAYVKVGIDTELGSLPLRGNIGVQSVTADQTSDLHLANGQVPASTPVDPGYRGHRGRQVHRCTAQPEPGARVCARDEAALRRRDYRGTSAPG